MNSSQNEGLSPSCIALSFDGFGSISWHSICFFGSYTVFTFFPLDFQRFWREYHLRDLSSRNAHLRIWCIKIGIVLILHSVVFSLSLKLISIKIYNYKAGLSDSVVSFISSSSGHTKWP
jgi:hypothetical protein